MDQNTLIIITAIVIGFAALIIFVNKRLSDIASGKVETGSDLLKDLSERLDRGLSEQRMSSERIIKDVTEKLKDLESTNKQVVGIADQLQGLENVLKNPKQRGILGEYYLETLLKNIFQPNQYQLQYKFSDGDIADAVLFVRDKKEPQSIIPIDSKFSLENYNKLCEEKHETRRAELEKQFKQDLKNRIDETAKYIKPKENTMDFAFMFIPSEGIYYDLLVNQVGAVKVNTRDLIEYAYKEKKVIIVSPTSFAAYLQTVLQGLKALTIEKSVKEIIQNVGKLGTHLNAYEDYMKKVGTHLSTTVNAYNAADKELGKIDKDVTKITGEAIGHEVEKIERPSSDD
ncbi:MAG: DNA recombination protein RmuC [Patescibacteria group bacterium]|nr:DNA recombination protein RmuC [Patescibacteria group bacterium]